MTIYSNNRYQSYDLDYVTYEDMAMVGKVLKSLGFNHKNKYFHHPDCKWFVEFVSPPVAVGNEPIHQFQNVKTPLGAIKLLRPVDSVKDRLAAFYHWNDRQTLQQAVDICMDQKVELDEIEQWSILEAQSEKFQIFTRLLREKKVTT